MPNVKLRIPPKFAEKKQFLYLFDLRRCRVVIKTFNYQSSQSM